MMAASRRGWQSAAARQDEDDEGRGDDMREEAAKCFMDFIGEARLAWVSCDDVGERMRRIQPLLQRLVSNQALKAAANGWPSTEGRKNLLLHTDEENGFVVNAVVRRPHRKGNAHDHSQAWVLYALLDGQESLERYDRLDDGSRPGYAEIKLASVTTGSAGAVDIVPPFAIHAEQGGPDRSVAIIFRSERLVGRHLQNGYDLETGEVVARPGPEQVPFDIAAGQPR
jgi:predicted metal-dependent enzyme (double-stranded beta helix superfamily)